MTPEVQNFEFNKSDTPCKGASGVAPAQEGFGKGNKNALLTRISLAAASLSFATVACSSETLRWMYTDPTPTASALRAVVGVLPVVAWGEIKLVKSLSLQNRGRVSILPRTEMQNEIAKKEGLPVASYDSIRKVDSHALEKSINKFVLANLFVFTPALVGAAYLGSSNQYWGWVLGVGPAVVTAMAALAHFTRRDNI